MKLIKIIEIEAILLIIYSCGNSYEYCAFDPIDWTSFKATLSFNSPYQAERYASDFIAFHYSLN